MKKDNHSENVSSSNQNEGDSNKNPELPNDKVIENKKEQINQLPDLPNENKNENENIESKDDQTFHETKTDPQLHQNIKQDSDAQSGFREARLCLVESVDQQ